MELWIRNQDKECLTKVEHLYIDNENKIRQDCDLILAEYNSKERALEVLDEIQSILKPTIITTGYECECKEDLKNKMNFNLEMIPTKTEIKELSCVIYEMPQK